jgi:signal transduction histidine kinase
MAAPAPAYEELRQREIDKFLTALLSKRVRLAPVGVPLMLLFVWTDSLVWRRILLIVVFTTMVVVQALTLRAIRRGTSASAAVGWNTALISVGMLGGVALTGGVDSPIAPVLIFFGSLLPLVLRRRGAIFAVSVSSIGMWVMTVVQATGIWQRMVPDLFGGGPYAGARALVLTRGIVIGWVLIVALVIHMMLRRTLEDVAQRSIRVRDEALADHAEQTRTLTTVAGEIAHELKNPLASIKGLSSLIARELAGKSAEQMVVLRREVDRMHKILDEFLNFSRPLVPLSLTDVDLGELCDDVLRLHEAVAAEHAVQLALAAGPPVRVRADRRKVKQVLINLVQNALDASPPAGRVEVQIARGVAAAARVRVIDGGAGLPSSVAERVFDAGVTTKPNGSGLGLTLSRALARQHGGELTLAAAPGGGCVAELTLPLEAQA